MGGDNGFTRCFGVSVLPPAVDHRGLPVRNILLWLLGLCFACIITAVEAVGLDWGD